uniref:Uncharacterized protein n=1 Tax=Candidatus Kentrum sp. TC TaxID=2126339 RepID=A0A450YBS9_9GAMM|nr:MAG: hypothetical protein BECKTC1821E_GA0114239_100380 [Candidatus Kentron sp. TC]VFK54627.1 MAG: hypothetical protein BECKTC1821F_GA0114240_100580 [Candidatus Kentron sp. TC]
MGNVDLRSPRQDGFRSETEDTDTDWQGSEKCDFYRPARHGVVSEKTKGFFTIPPGNASPAKIKREINIRYVESKRL